MNYTTVNTQYDEDNSECDILIAKMKSLKQPFYQLVQLQRIA